MMVRVLLVVLVLFAFPVSARAEKPIDWNDRQIAWHSYEEGLKSAQSSGKNILAVFYADWCSNCAKHAKQYFDPKIVALSQNVVMVKVDHDEAPDLSATYMPDGEYVPRTMVLRPDGTLVSELGGSNPEHLYFLDYDKPEELLTVMQKAPAAR